MLPELLELDVSRRDHFFRVGVLPPARVPTVLDLLEPTGEVSIAWAGSVQPMALRRFVLAHETCEPLAEQVGLYPAECEPASGLRPAPARAA